MGFMINTKKHLSRRTVLRGLGATLALPLLDGMVPALTALQQTAAKPVRRFGAFYLPNGMSMARWTPTGDGVGFAFSEVLEPLTPYRDRLVVLSGMCSKEADPLPGEGDGDHSRAQAGFLTGAHAKKTGSGADLEAGISLDQIAAKEFGKETQLASLELALESYDLVGQCEDGYGCAYSATIAWRNAKTPLPMEADPRKLFERLFGQGDTPQERKAITKQYTSILDLVSREAADLQKTLDAPDRAKVGDYLESVREIERRVQKMEAQDLSALALPDVPVSTSFDQRLNLMFDMIALAYQANLTRVFTYMMAGEGSNVTYNHIGVSDAFHPLSHHQNDKSRKDRLVKIQTYHSQAFAKFLTKLAAMPDGDGSVLDHSILLYGSNMSNSNAHDEFPLPTIVVGGGAGKMKGGQHLKYEDRTPLANLLLTLLDRAGVPVEKVGNSTQVFSEI